MIEVIHVTIEEYRNLKNAAEELERIKFSLSQQREEWLKERNIIRQIAGIDPPCAGQQIANKYLWDKASEVY